MSTPGPFGGGNPFEGMPIFGDLAKLFSNQGPVNWDVARQIGGYMAAEGQSEGNVDPIERIKLEELARVAELQIGDFTGLATSVQMAGRDGHAHAADCARCHGEPPVSGSPPVWI